MKFSNISYAIFRKGMKKFQEEDHHCATVRCQGIVQGPGQDLGIELNVQDQGKNREND